MPKAPRWWLVHGGVPLAPPLGSAADRATAVDDAVRGMPRPTTLGRTERLTVN